MGLTREQAVEILATKIGCALKLGRLKRGLSIAEVAAMTGVPEGKILRIEHGEYTEGLSSIGSLASACDVEMDFQMIDMRPAHLNQSEGE